MQKGGSCCLLFGCMNIENVYTSETKSYENITKMKIYRRDPVDSTVESVNTLCIFTVYPPEDKPFTTF